MALQFAANGMVIQPPRPTKATRMRDEAAKNPGRAYLYVRVSDEKQVSDGFSLETQVNNLMAYYEKELKPLGVAWRGDVHCDLAVSAWKMPAFKRPAVLALDAELQPGDHILVARNDRLIRGVACYVEIRARWLMSKCVKLHILNFYGMDVNCGIGQMVLGVLTQFAEEESRIKSQRMTEVNHTRRQQGRPVNGKKPWGWKQKTVDGKLVFVRDREELAVMKMIEHEHRMGKMPDLIVEQMGRLGVLPDRQPWTESKIRRAVAAVRDMDRKTG